MSEKPDERILVPTARLEQLIGSGDPTSAEIHDMAVELINRRLADISKPRIEPSTPARIRKGCRWKPGPVVIHMIDGRTALVSRTDSFLRQKWWISIDNLEISK